MESLKILLAVLLPLFVGAAIISLMLPSPLPGRKPLVCGNGLLLGLIAVPVVMRCLDVIGIPLLFTNTSTCLAALVVIALVAPRLRGPGPLSDGVTAPAPPAISPGDRLLFGFFLLLILLRISTVGMELVSRPLFPWDATMHWATKAKVWFDAARMVPFVESRQWLELGGAGVYTDHPPGSPATIPLLQAWVSSALGRWDESLINLPWLLCLIGLGAAFYGQARVAGVPALPAMAFTYMLLSMPLLDTHVALAGYADLFLGASYCAAIMALHNWSLTRDRGQAAVALVFALSCPLIKNEGFYWLLSFIPALVVVFLPMRRALQLLAAGLVLLVVVLIMIPSDFAVAGHSYNELLLRYRPGALSGIGYSIWMHDNWHLLGYLLVGLLVLALAQGTQTPAKLPFFAVALATALALFLVLFVFTRYSSGAIRFTAVGRISLHLMPGMMFLAMILYHGIRSRRCSLRPAGVQA